MQTNVLLEAKIKGHERIILHFSVTVNCFRLNNVDNAMTLYTGFLHRLKVNAEREDCSIKVC